MTNVVIALTAISFYRAASSAANPRPASFAGFTTQTTTGLGTASATQFDQYALRAAQDGMYPVMQRGFKEPVGNIFLKQGEVWKYGETMHPSTRYSGSFLTNTGNGLRFFPEFKTPSFKEAFQIQKQKIVDYEVRFGKLPPGNKIRG